MNRKKNLLNRVTVKLGCMSSCSRPKLSSIFSPKPKPAKYHQSHFNQHYYYPPSTATTTFSDNDYCYNYQTTPTTATSNTTTSSSPFVTAEEIGRAVAVEKDSSDPYLDFRASMLQMIVENEMYTKDDLRHLLTCFLHLNSPCLHGVIITAFTDIWNSFFFPSAAAATTSTTGQGHGRNHHGGRPAGTRDSYGRPPKAYVRAKSYEI